MRKIEIDSPQRLTEAAFIMREDKDRVKVQAFAKVWQAQINRGDASEGAYMELGRGAELWRNVNGKVKSLGMMGTKQARKLAEEIEQEAGTT